MSTHALGMAVEELAQQFEKQGMRCTEDESAPLLWCSYCAAYLSEKGVLAKDREGQREGSGEVPESEPRRDGSRARPSGADNAAASLPPLAVLKPTKDAILEHCTTRLHLLLYEHHTQEDLRQWCAVELHGYRMLLNHHCVYPARMFGDGRMLMDFTIAGGMLLGQDVCGGVKMWPQHRYAAAELVLPSARSGVREVWEPPPPPERDGGGAAPSLKRPREGGRHRQLLHETSEMPAEVAWAYSNESQGDEHMPWFLRKAHEERLQFVPRYFDEDHGLRSRRVMGGSLTTVLDATNASIGGEARLREQRRRHAIQHNLVDGGEGSATAPARDRGGESEYLE